MFAADTATIVLGEEAEMRAWKVAHVLCAVTLLFVMTSLFEARPKAELGICCSIGADCNGNDLCCASSIIGALPCSSSNPDQDGYCLSVDTCRQELE